MTSKPNNPAAFPGGVNQAYTNIEPGDPTQKGMLLRDYFAAQVVSAVFHGVFEDWRQNKAGIQGDWPTGIAVDAYRVADAMLKIREATDTMAQEFQKHYRRGYETGKKAAPQPTQAADSAMEYAERLKEAAGLLEELAEHDSYSTEYGGRMISLCPECGEQEGDHRPNCAFVRAKAFLAARKRGSAMTEPIKLNKIRTSELTGAALDWAVAKCEGLRLHKDALLGGVMKDGWWASGYYTDPNQWTRLGRLRYSTSWAQGGPIIEREHISTEWSSLWDCWTARDLRNAAFSFMGPTPLIVAMRSFVASRLGEEVEVPDELA